jgi:F-type H+-transporting ATPase subunit alpha
MSENGGPSSIDGVLNGVFDAAASVLAAPGPEPEIEETGRVERVGQGVAMIRGLPRVKADELLIFPGGASGMAFGLEPDRVDAVLLARADRVCAGMEARRSGRVIDVPVGEGLLGRVIDPLGGVLDEGPPLEPGPRYPIERDAPAIMDRAPVSVPLQTGILSVDALIPVGRGQRELILGDRQVGKTALALDAILNQRGKGVVCVYCSIGQQNSATAKVVAELRDRGAMSYTIVVAVGGDEGPGLNFLAPYAATSIGEFFMERGEDVLVVYDDLSRHARSYRELSLLLRRPPAREAYPGDIFYIHSRLLERATHLVPERGGGSLTALPIVETEGQNIAAYIPTNLVSITDGQIYLTPRLFQGGMLPPVDVGKSVSRVGGAAQLPAYRAVAGPLRLSYSQFEELEVFERFSTRLDEGTRAALERGHRIREALRQARYEPLEVSAQIAILLALTRGLFDPVPVSAMRAAMARIAAMMRGELAAVSRRIEGGELLTEEDETLMLATASAAIAPIGPGSA